MLERARDELAVVGKKLYFNTGWSGPSPWRVIEEQKRVLDWLSIEGVSHHIYGKLKEYVGILRTRLAPLLGADPGLEPSLLGIDPGVHATPLRLPLWCNSQPSDFRRFISR